MSLWDQISNNLLTWGPLVFMALIVFFLWRTMKLMPKTKPQEIKPDSDSSIKWDEVAGVDEAKAELREVVEFLTDPERFKKLGAKVPKGILLHGPPGTGKTLLAKAVANESGAQFFSQSAASFVEMFAGLGAARIRRLFARGAQATRPRSSSSTRSTPSAPARLGQQLRARADAQPAAGRDGRLQSTSGDLVVIAASNLLDKLDPALLRPGRFDRQIFVSPPDVVGRKAILGVHTANKPLAKDVDFEVIARQTSGLTGAELANICNEAAIAAARGLAPARRAGRLRVRARARRGRHGDAPHAQRARAPRRRLPRGRPRAAAPSCCRARRARTASRSSRAAPRSATSCTSPRRTATSTRGRS